MKKSLIIIGLCILITGCISREPVEEYLASELFYAQNIIKPIDPPIDTLTPKPPITTLLHPGKNYETTPILRNALRKLHQNWPLNIYCHTEIGTLSYAGCAAVAAGAIMVHFKWP